MARTLIGLAVLFAAALPTTASAAWTWQPLERLTPADVATGDGVAAVTSEDAVVLAYGQVDAGTGALALHARVQMPGSGFGATQLLGQRVRTPAIATDGQGGTHVAWEHEPPTGAYRERQRILVSSAGADGVFGEPVDVGQGQDRVAIAANARGDVVVGWYRYRDEGRRLMAAMKPHDGEWSAPEDISGLIPSEMVSGSNTIALTPDGEAIFGYVQVASGSSPERHLPHAATWRGAGTSPVRHDLSTPGWDITYDGRPGVAVGADGAGNLLAVFAEDYADSWNGRLVVATRVGSAPSFAVRRRPLEGSGSPLLGVTADGEFDVLSGGRRADLDQDGGLHVLRGDLASGALGEATQLPGGGGDMTLHMNRDGTALLAGSGAYEVSTIRRDADGVWSAPQTVYCPRENLRPLVAGVASGGTAHLFLQHNEYHHENPGWFGTHDVPSAEPGLTECPWPFGPTFVMTPAAPVAGDPVLLDASGMRHRYAVESRFQWIFADDDRVDTGTDPTVRHTWHEPGRHWLGVRVTDRFKDGTESVGETSIWVDVGEKAAPPGDVTPALAPPPAAPAAPRWSPPTARRASTWTVVNALFAPARMRLRTARRRGIVVRVRALPTSPVRLSLSLRGRRLASVLLRPTTFETTGVLRLGAKGLRRLRRAADRHVTLSARQDGRVIAQRSLRFSAR